MSTSHPTETLTPAQRATRARARAWLAATAVALAVVSFAWITYSRGAIAQHEARILSGDFAALRTQTGKLEIDHHGRVIVDGFLSNPPITVASTRLIPPGEYAEIIVANDGVAEHAKKTELVIGGRDTKGAWHPASAGSLITRVKTSHRPGGPL